MQIKELCKEAHKIAIDKGFWELDKNKKLKFRNQSELLMLIVSELGEACEALRKNNRQVQPKSLGQKRRFDLQGTWEKDTFEDEIADVFIRLGDMCEALDIDIVWQIKKKMEYNKTRPKKHGKAF